MQGALEVLDMGSSVVVEGRSGEEVMTGPAASVSLDVESKGGWVKKNPASLLEDESVGEDADSARLEEATSAEIEDPASLIEGESVDGAADAAGSEEAVPAEAEGPASLPEGGIAGEEGESRNTRLRYPGGGCKPCVTGKRRRRRRCLLCAYRVGRSIGRWGCRTACRRRLCD